MIGPEVSRGDRADRSSAVVNFLTGLLGLLTVLLVVLFCLVAAGLLFFGDTSGLFRQDTPVPVDTLTPLRYTDTATLFPTETLIPTLTTTPTPTEIVPFEPAPTDIVPLSEQGPWLLIGASDGLWILAPDASWMVRLSETPLLAPEDLRRAAAPVGGHVAYITGTEQPVLTIVHIPDGKTRLRLPLSVTRAAISSANRRALSGDALAWSPDGRSLAFIGLQEGSRASLYLYSLDTESVTRLSDGERYAFQPHWSPDGGLILYSESEHMEEDEALAVMAVLPGSGERRTLYEVFDSRAEVIAGWSQANRFLVYSRKADCELADLRLIRTETGVAELYNIGCVNAVAIQPDRGTILYVSDDNKDQPGVFLLPAGLGNPRPLRGGAADNVQWNPLASLFFVHDSNGWGRAFAPDGTMADIPAAVRGLLPEVSAVSGLWAWATKGDELPGLWISAPQTAPHKIFAAPASLPRWGPDGQTLFFFYRNDLYVAYGPRFEPNLLTSFPPGVVQAVWVGK
ncbi:MAG: hypothetical protein WHV66_05150 [Anaerolineales bacterium]